jgi:hypothetical protein
MAYRLRVGGKITETTGGNKTVFAERNIVTNANKSIMITSDVGHFHGDPDDAPPVTNKNIVDIVMFVAGTTDPINIKGEKHQANKNYWRDSQNNFWGKVKELKPQYLNLHIEDTFFSWSGDNNTDERNLAADRLLDLFVRVYPGFKNKEVHLHLIGHSHGGNVVNQFTELIATDKRFPKLWKTKSITYLSTPFFQKKHQLNHTKLHKDCKIINVHNEYDITQQFVADFSLINLEILIRKFEKGDFDDALNRIKETDFKPFAIISDSGYWGKINNTQGHDLWRNTAVLLDGVGMLMKAIAKYINSIDTNKFKSEKIKLLDLFERIRSWSLDSKTTFIKNQVTRKGGYNRDAYFSDINLLGILKLVNELLSIKTGVKDSYLLVILSVLFAENSGITESIDETSWTPKKQIGPLSLKDVLITNKDTYDGRRKKVNFDKFLLGIQGAQKKKNLEELLMRLFSQFITANQIQEIRDKIDKLEYVVSGESDTQLKQLRKTNLKLYEELITMYNADLVSKIDLSEELMKRPGSIPYLAMVSHSLSHTQFWKDVEAELRSAFSSGINTGYKKK